MATVLELAAEIVASHASTTGMSTEELLGEIEKVYGALLTLETGKGNAFGEKVEVKVPLPLKQAFKANEVICLECGKGGMKTLTRHIKQMHSMKPGEYRKKYGIKTSQSLAARNFSEARRKMAQERGLANNLVKAREVRAANLLAKKSAPKSKRA